ncbi:hypothetical protein LCGC14_0649270 [marine sediment metagenome]|uniref:Uncharacterized protein n=1 Tax=marine sediment metagenome TaxID=412755 RepID=A0A0F9RGI0_9ZZZZ
MQNVKSDYNSLYGKDFLDMWLNNFKKSYDYDYFKNLAEDIEKNISIKRQSTKNLLTKIIEAYETELLVLVLGAGVSVEYGLPSWDTLLQKLLLTSFQDQTAQDPKKSIVLAKLFTKVFSPNPLIAARYLSNHYKNITSNESNSFEKAVRSALYEQIKKNHKSELFDEITKLCVSPGKTPNLDSIITYNYDDILENHLKDTGVEVQYKSIHKNGVQPESGQLPIYHVHGYLPRRGRIIESSLVTLSEDVYHKQYSDIYSWNNMVQINKFRDKVCLFIGLSLTDPNLRRILDIANSQRGKNKSQHYALRRKYDRNVLREQLENILQQTPDIFDEKAKARLKLDETVKYLAQVIERFETQDDLSFGINTIWLDDYTYIPKILRSIRDKKSDLSL